MAVSKSKPSNSGRRSSLGSTKKLGPALFSADRHDDGQSLSLGSMNNAEAPKEKPMSFKLARIWKQKNLYISSILDMKQGYSTFGLNIVSRDEDEQEAFEKWLTGGKKKAGKAADAKTKKELWIRRFVNDCHSEGWLNDNVAPMWFSEDPLKSDYPAILQLEDCKYSDVLGQERMVVDFGIKTAADKQQLRDAGLSEAQILRYSKLVVLDEDQGEHFIVWTRGISGRGFCYPRMWSVFRTCSQQEHMEVGESLLAYSGRLVVRMHRKGWEPRQTAVQLKLKDFMWTTEWADQIKKNFAPGKNGFMEATGNFDHKIETHWIDPKMYDGEKWNTILNRLIWWAGPLGFMLLAKTNSDNWMTLFQTEIESFQEKITPYLEYALNAVYPDAPGGIKIEYGNSCFKDSRLLWDMLKTLMATGPASLTTGLKAAGLNVKQENENRKHEKKNEKVFGAPLYDPAHGDPEDATADKGGRKKGGKDGDAV